MIKIRGFTITYTNAAFLGLGFVLGYGKALRDSEEIMQRLDAMYEALVQNGAVSEDPEEAAERRAKAEAIPGTAVEVIPELPKESI